MNEGQLTGTIIKILEPRTGTSKNTGKDFFVQEYIVETQEEYPTKVHFSIFGEDRVRGYNLQQGDAVQVFFYVNSREYNERWYTDIRVRNIVKIDPSQMAAPRVESLMESLWSIVPAEYLVEGLTDLIPPVVGVLLLLVSGQQLAQLAEVRHDTLTKRDERLLRHRCGGAHPIDQRLHLSHRVSSGADIPLLYRTRGDVLQHPEECR